LAWYWYLLVLVVAAAGTAIAVPFTIKLAQRLKAIDYPDGRRVNTRPTPRLGGIALLLGLLLGIGALFIVDKGFGKAVSDNGLDHNVNYLGALISVLVIFAVGVIDDLINLRARYKLLGQIIAGCIAAASGVLFGHFANPFTGSIVQLGWLSYPITVFYLVAFANIINLIDGLDGLAAGIVAISAAALFFLATSFGGLDAAALSIAMIGACLAFLCFNFYPARIFMGDSGSLLLGFTLGVVSLFGVVRTPALITMLVPVVIAGLPVIDTFSAIIRRIRSRKGILEPDTDHMHHAFLKIGFDQRSTVLIMYALSALLAFAAFLVLNYSGPVRILILGILLVVIIFLIQRLGLFDPVLRHHYSKRGGTDGQKAPDNLTDQDQKDPAEKAAAAMPGSLIVEEQGADGHPADNDIDSARL
jgi:UDP-GlcNAc:undecaprenyl-phosphate GlcNAc-1-phosphate transferase